MGFCFVFAVITLLAVIILVVRDGIQYRLKEEQKTLEERIAEIHRTAVFLANQLEGRQDRPISPDMETETWIPPVIIFNRRLAELAAASDPSVEDIQKLADESAMFVRQQRVKGILVPELAKKLAVLVQRRKASRKN